MSRVKRDAEAAEEQERYDESLDNATHAVIGEFAWLGLPNDADPKGRLMCEINDAINEIMRRYKEFQQ